MTIYGTKTLIPDTRVTFVGNFGGGGGKEPHVALISNRNSKSIGYTSRH